jgi:hypothetical protein
MPLNNIRLNSFLAATMYKNFIVELNEIQSDEKDITPEPLSEIDPIAETEIKYLGNFKKNILLIVRNPNLAFIPDEQLNFVTSVLSACKLSLDDVAIMNIASSSSTAYNDVQKKFNSAVCILFGVSPSEFSMPIHFPEFQIQPFNKCTFLYTPLLEEMESDKILKSKFWVCLKKIFDL